MSMFQGVALITGAGSGIGRQLALTLAAEGMTIAAVDLRPEGLSSLEGELKAAGRAAGSAVADVADAEAVRAAVTSLEQRLGPTELLIASAGIGIETPARDFRSDDFQAQIRVNLVGVANSVAAVLPGMLQRRRGHLAAISSLASYRGMPGMAGYCASKAGVNALMDSLRVELAPLGIHVTTVCPGFVRTPMTAGLHLPPSAVMDVAAAARRIVGAIRRRRAFYAFPAAGVWRLRVLSWLPRRLADWLLARMMRQLSGK
jgi:NAD(P)-dependent dehydrogenase (short-subunit alcohol dehydrogenase family)